MHSQDENFLFSSFHTYDYARHFVSACTRILGLEGTPEGVEDQGRLTRVAAVCSSKSSSCFPPPPPLALISNNYIWFINATCFCCSNIFQSEYLHVLTLICLFYFSVFLQFPIGIDSDRFIRALEAAPVQDNIRELAERFKGRKVHFIFTLHWC